MRTKRTIQPHINADGRRWGELMAAFRPLASRVLLRPLKVGLTSEARLKAGRCFRPNHLRTSAFICGSIVILCPIRVHSRSDSYPFVVSFSAFTLQELKTRLCC
jgi:hypothetical protein